MAVQDPSEFFNWDIPDVGSDSGAWGTLLNEIIADDATGIDKVLNDVKTTADAALPKAGGVMTGEVELFTSRGKLVALGTSGTLTMDFDAANAWTCTPTGTTTFAVSNVPGSAIVAGILKLTNGGSVTVSWPASFKWSGGTAPSLTASGVDLIAFVSFDGGTSFQAVAHLDLS